MNESLDNHSQANPNGGKWEKMMSDFIGRFSGGESRRVPQYEYGRSENIEEIMKNPEEYIIPECLEACKKLWSKNIETLMCANYSGNSDLFIVLPGIDSLSDENQEIFKDNSEEGFTLGEEHDNPEIEVAGQTQESVATLIKLVDRLKTQDVRRCRYQTAEEFLEEYKYGDVPVINGRGFEVHVSSDEEVKTLLSEYDALTNKQEPEFFAKYMKFDTYRKIVLR